MPEDINIQPDQANSGMYRPSGIEITKNLSIECREKCKKKDLSNCMNILLSMSAVII